MSDARDMTCPKCGSVLSAVTWTCVRGDYCPGTKKVAVTDIVERLRDRDICSIAHNSCRNDRVCAEAADEIERLRAALDLGLRMQEAQKAYFKGRTKEALIASKEIEREFAQTARALLEEKPHV